MNTSVLSCAILSVALDPDEVALGTVPTTQTRDDGDTRILAGHGPEVQESERRSVAFQIDNRGPGHPACPECGTEIVLPRSVVSG